MINNLDISKIIAILGEPYMKSEDSYSWSIIKSDSRDKLLLNIYTNVTTDNEQPPISLISAQNDQGYFELHNCNKYIVFEPDEIIFLNSSDNHLSSLVVSASGNLSVFSNISSDILKKDISTLNAALIMSAMQLSIAESVLD